MLRSIYNTMLFLSILVLPLSGYSAGIERYQNQRPVYQNEVVRSGSQEGKLVKVENKLGYEKKNIAAFGKDSDSKEIAMETSYRPSYSKRVSAPSYSNSSEGASVSYQCDPCSYDYPCYESCPEESCCDPCWTKYLVPAAITATGIAVAVVYALDNDCDPGKFDGSVLQFTGSFQATADSEDPGDNTLVFEILDPEGAVIYTDTLVSGNSTSGNAVTFESPTFTNLIGGEQYTVNVTSLTATGSSLPQAFIVNATLDGNLFDSPQSDNPAISPQSYIFTIP